MSEDTGQAGAEGLSQAEDEIAIAERRLQEAAAAASVAEQRATAEIRALEADLEKAKLQTAEELEKLHLKHKEELKEEREAKERAISAAENRLAEIEKQADAAEQRVQEAEHRAAEAERQVSEASVRARESAAAWLRAQIAEIRREAGQQQ